MVKLYIYLSNPSQKQFHFRHFHTFPSYLHVFFYFLIMFFSPQILVEISGLSTEQLYTRNIYLYNMLYQLFGTPKVTVQIVRVILKIIIMLNHLIVGKSRYRKSIRTRASSASQLARASTQYRNRPRIKGLTAKGYYKR